MTPDRPPAAIDKRLLHFEDFCAGEPLPVAELEVEDADATWFAEAFGLPVDRGVVSAWFASVLGMRLLCAALLNRAASLGAPGIDEVRWDAPLRVGDRLRFSGEVVAARPSRSRPDTGLVTIRFSLATGGGSCVMTQANTLLMRRRQATADP